MGRRGKHDFAAGFYVYVGSAFGPGGVRARLAHHLRVSGNPHWHIDYLRQVAEVVQVWYSECGDKQEHQWAAAVAKVAGCQPMEPGFGASDCACATHLFYFNRQPSAGEFQAQICDPRSEIIVWQPGNQVSHFEQA